MAERDVIVDAVVQLRHEGTEKVVAALGTVEQKAQSSADKAGKLSSNLESMGSKSSASVGQATNQLTRFSTSIEKATEPVRKLQGALSSAVGIATGFAGIAGAIAGIGIAAVSAFNAINTKSQESYRNFLDLNKATLDLQRSMYLASLASDRIALATAQTAIQEEEHATQVARSNMSLAARMEAIERYNRASQEQLRLQIEIIRRQEEAQRRQSEAQGNNELLDLQRGALALTMSEADKIEERYFQLYERIAALREGNADAAFRRELDRIEQVYRREERQALHELEKRRNEARREAMEQEQQDRRRLHEERMKQIEAEKQAQINANVQVFNELQSLRQRQTQGFGALDGSGVIVDAIRESARYIGRKASKA